MTMERRSDSQSWYDAETGVHYFDDGTQSSPPTAGVDHGTVPPTFVIPNPGGGGEDLHRRVGELAGNLAKGTKPPVAKLPEMAYKVPDQHMVPPGDKLRTFETGATRHVDNKKHDYEGYLSIRALRCYGDYMLGHQIQADGTRRDSDNWQKGIPLEVYMKSLVRHTFDVWAIGRGIVTTDTKDDHEVVIEEALCGVIFNAFGYLHEFLKIQEEDTDDIRPTDDTETDGF